MTAIPLQAFIGMGLAIGKTAERGHPDYGTALGNAHKLDSSQAVWNIFTAFGSMAFAYSYVSACLRLPISPKQHSCLVSKVLHAFHFFLATVNKAGKSAQHIISNIIRRY